MNKTLTVYNKLTKKWTQVTLNLGQYLRFKIHKVVQVSDDPEEIFLSQCLKCKKQFLDHRAGYWERKARVSCPLCETVRYI